ncbi:DUF4214 domain-containing protein [Plastoroseomonas arctica]|uniref:DUF4214 domain-containing protein n=1 Tax=Plastoroseomonas arctica TaxID=1509237 RepID=A0AAF1K6V6_9PROT|nr:DUF4214 domain-containing protein [Plastoroseomonas arctica]MBR0657468.1 DUF4214 domain-containing protein [Plastoroseomonas arctica]
MKRILASELEGGDDHEFLVRLYTHVLDRWPDRDGYSHYLARIDGKPEARSLVIRDVARSEEARKLDVEVVFPDGEPAAAEAAPPIPAVSPPPTVAPRPAPPAVPPPAPFAAPSQAPAPGPVAPLATIAAEVASLRAKVSQLEAEIAALRSERGAVTTTPEAPPSASLLEDVAQQIDALFALGLAGLEARLVALERGQHGG